MYSAIFDVRKNVGSMALAHVERGEYSSELIADALCSQLKKPEDFADRYLKRLPELLEELRREKEVVVS